MQYSQSALNGAQEIANLHRHLLRWHLLVIHPKLERLGLDQEFLGRESSRRFSLPYRLTADGSKDSRTFYADAYSFRLDRYQKPVHSLSLPSNRGGILVFAVNACPRRELIDGAHDLLILHA